MPVLTINLPTYHADQVKAYLRTQDDRQFEGHPKYDAAWAENTGGRFLALRCGRRYGKSTFGGTWLSDGAIRGYPCGLFAPDYKKISEMYQEIYDMVLPIKRSSSKTEGVIRTMTGGRIDFWTLENESAGRSRKYKRVFLDEIAFTKSNMMDIWKRSIKPTLLDYTGQCIAASNTNGINSENFMWQICNQPEHGFIEHHAKSWDNPNMPARLIDEDEGVYQLRRQAEFDSIKAREHPFVWRQEYEAEFVDWSGVAFFTLEKLLVEGLPVELPRRVDAVFAVIDTATKTGTDNDGTAVTYYARTKFGGHPLIVLDWDLVQIEGALLESWLPTVAQNLEAWAKRLNAMSGSLGIWIEDKASGEILLQQARKRNIPARPIESRLTALGKDERALSVSGYHYRGEVKIAREAFEKTVMFKKATRNHFVTQITGFRIGDKEAYRRADDLLDCYTYGLAIGLGDSGGF